MYATDIKMKCFLANIVFVKLTNWTAVIPKFCTRMEVPKRPFLTQDMLSEETSDSEEVDELFQF